MHLRVPTFSSTLCNSASAGIQSTGAEKVLGICSLLLAQVIMAAQIVSEEYLMNRMHCSRSAQEHNYQHLFVLCSLCDHIVHFDRRSGKSTTTQAPMLI